MGAVASTGQRALQKDSVPGALTSGSEVCAVLVTFHPDEALPARIERVLLEVAALVVVDNGSDEAALGMWRRVSADPRIALVLNFANLGIARALNLGIARAGSMGYAWVLLLDQDSVVDPGMLNAMIGIRDAYRRHPWSLRVPISGPPLGPNNVAWLEQGLRALSATPLSEQQHIIGRVKASGAPLGLTDEHDIPDYAGDPDGKRMRA